MKGTLTKTQNGWEVIILQATLNGPLMQSLPLHPDDAAGLFIQDTDNKYEGQEIEFDSEWYWPMGHKKREYARIIHSEVTENNQDFFDEDHALDLVMNSMVADIEKEDLENNIKETAVSMIFDHYNLMSETDFKSWMINNYDMLHKIEKQQIVDAFGVGCQVNAKKLIGYHNMAEQYYNKNYKKIII